MHGERGVTLVELAVALAVLAACTAVGVPALRDFTRAQRANGAIATLSAHLADARLAAITHNQPVVVCPARPPVPGCVDDTDWSRGLVAFFDPDGDRRPDGPGQVITLDSTPVSGDLRLRTSSGRRHLRYRSDGSRIGSNLSFELCDAEGRLLGRVVVNVAGRTRTERPAGPASCA